MTSTGISPDKWRCRYFSHLSVFAVVENAVADAFDDLPLSVLVEVTDEGFQVIQILHHELVVAPLVQVVPEAAAHLVLGKLLVEIGKPTNGQDNLLLVA